MRQFFVKRGYCRYCFEGCLVCQVMFEEGLDSVELPGAIPGEGQVKARVEAGRIGPYADFGAVDESVEPVDERAVFEHEVAEVRVSFEILREVVQRHCPVVRGVQGQAANAY